jgi:drug/metabolite transporter (DMT)-like permease
MGAVAGAPNPLDRDADDLRRRPAAPGGSRGRRTRSWTALAYLVLVGSLIGFSAYTWLLPNARISLISTYAYVNPIVAVFLGWVVLGERITGRTLVASAIVIAAVVIVVTGRSVAVRRERPDSTVPEPLGEAV